MSLQPLIDASFAIQLHVATVIPAALIGAFILGFPKGSVLHRLLGRMWVCLMVVTSLSTFFIHELRVFYGFSPIHLLSIATIFSCWKAVQAARRGDIRQHVGHMRGTYFGGIVIAGGFTFLPGRIMNEVLFGAGGRNLLIAFIGGCALVLLLMAGRHILRGR